MPTDPRTPPPWRLVIFDPATAEDDPRWLLVEVTAVRAADMDETGRRYTDWQSVTNWVREVCGWQTVQMIPQDVGAQQIWRAEPGGPRPDRAAAAPQP